MNFIQIFSGTNHSYLNLNLVKWACPLARSLPEQSLPFNAFNVPKWSDTLYKSCSIYCKTFKVCLAIFGRYVFKVKVILVQCDKMQNISIILYQSF